jgi:hypothetical protein
VALLAASGRLTSDVKLLTWGQPYEYEYLERLGVQRDQIVPYNASRVYCAGGLTSLRSRCLWSTQDVQCQLSG